MKWHPLCLRFHNPRDEGRSKIHDGRRNVSFRLFRSTHNALFCFLFGRFRRARAPDNHPEALSLSFLIVPCPSCSPSLRFSLPLAEITKWSLEALILWKMQGDVWRWNAWPNALPPSPVFTLADMFGQIFTVPDGKLPRSEGKTTPW